MIQKPEKEDLLFFAQGSSLFQKPRRPNIDFRTSLLKDAGEVYYHTVKILTFDNFYISFAHAGIPRYLYRDEYVSRKSCKLQKKTVNVF